MAKARVRKVSDDAWLTQFGEKMPQATPRDHLRTQIGETEMSLILGRLDPEAASKIVMKRVSPLADVRYVKAGTLRAAGFLVRHDPTKNNPRHVSVHPPIEQGAPVDWDDDIASKFKGCFETDTVQFEAAEEVSSNDA
jgi:hypothetical protein